MQVAEVVRRGRWRSTPRCAFAAYDGSSAGPARAAPDGRAALAARASPTSPTAPGDSGWPVPTCRRPRRRRRPVRGARRCSWTRPSATCPGASSCGSLRALGPQRLLHASPPPPQEAPRRRGAGCGTPRRATPRRSATTTTSRTASTSGCSARRWPTPARSTRPTTRPWRRRRRQVRPGRAASSACSPACGCSTSAAAGAAWSCTPRSDYGVQALGVTLSRAAGRVGAEGDRRRGAAATWPRSGSWTTATSPRRGFDAVSSIGLTEHIGQAQLPSLLPLPVRQAAAGRPAAQPLHHPARHQHRAPRRRGVHQPLRLPRRRAAAGRPARLARCRTPASRSGTRRTCASTTRMTLRDWCANLDAHWDEAVEEVGEGTGPGLAALHGRRRGSGFDATTSSCTRCWA